MEKINGRQLGKKVKLRLDDLNLNLTERQVGLVMRALADVIHASVAKGKAVGLPRIARFSSIPETRPSHFKKGRIMGRSRISVRSSVSLRRAAKEADPRFLEDEA